MSTILIRTKDTDKPPGLVYLKQDKDTIIFDIVASIYQDGTIIFEPLKEVGSKDVDAILDIQRNFELIHNSIPIQ